MSLRGFYYADEPATQQKTVKSKGLPRPADYEDYWYEYEGLWYNEYDDELEEGQFYEEPSAEEVKRKKEADARKVAEAEAKRAKEEAARKAKEEAARKAAEAAKQAKEASQKAMKGMSNLFGGGAKSGEQKKSGGFGMGGMFGGKEADKKPAPQQAKPAPQQTKQAPQQAKPVPAQQVRPAVQAAKA